MESAADRGGPQPGAASGPSHLTGVIVVGMSAAVWWPAFTLGAWGELFFDTMLAVWAASAAAALVVLFSPRARHRITSVVALLVPSLWIAFSFIVAAQGDDDSTAVFDLLAAAIMLLAIPATIWVLAGIVWPEFQESVSWPRRLLMLGCVAAVAIASFVLGVNQSRFLTCEDFTISGNSEPPGCLHLDG